MEETSSGSLEDQDPLVGNKTNSELDQLARESVPHKVSFKIKIVFVIFSIVIIGLIIFIGYSYFKGGGINEGSYPEGDIIQKKLKNGNAPPIVLESPISKVAKFLFYPGTFDETLKMVVSPSLMPTRGEVFVNAGDFSYVTIEEGGKNQKQKSAEYPFNRPMKIVFGVDINSHADMNNIAIYFKGFDSDYNDGNWKKLDTELVEGRSIVEAYHGKFGYYEVQAPYRCSNSELNEMGNDEQPEQIFTDRRNTLYISGADVIAGVDRGVRFGKYINGVLDSKEDEDHFHFFVRRDTDYRIRVRHHFQNSTNAPLVAVKDYYAPEQFNILQPEVQLEIKTQEGMVERSYVLSPPTDVESYYESGPDKRIMSDFIVFKIYPGENPIVDCSAEYSITVEEI